MLAFKKLKRKKFYFNVQFIYLDNSQVFDSYKRECENSSNFATLRVTIIELGLDFTMYALKIVCIIIFNKWVFAQTTMMNFGRTLSSPFLNRQL